MGGADINALEDKMLNTVLTKRIRLNEFFQDFDKKRTGFVTGSQFIRVLWENLSIALSEEEQEALIRKYDVRGDGTVNWRCFCNSVQRKFDANNLSIDPTCQTVNALELLGTSRSLRPLSPRSEEYMEQLLRRLQKYYDLRGIDFHTECVQLDSHNRGSISESQFFRRLAHPSDFTEEDMVKLVDKYRDPTQPDRISYRNITNDLQALAKIMNDEATKKIPGISDVAIYLPTDTSPDESLETLLDRIRATVYTSRIRASDFFQDYDKKRSGVISKSQFVKALYLAVGKEAMLRPVDVQKLVEFYRIPDGRVAYREFIEMLRNVFTVADLIKKPTQDVAQIGEGALGRSLSVLSYSEEQKVKEVIDTLRDQVIQRRILVYPVFKDLKRRTTNYQLVTRSQFERILGLLSLDLSPEDLRLMMRKFTDRKTRDINYGAFCQSIDGQVSVYKQDNVKSYNKPGEPPVECTPKPDEVVDLDHLMPRLRHIVLTSRVRVSEYMNDFDPGRTGEMTISQFERCLGRLGFDSLGRHQLTKPQFNALVNFYRSPNDDGKVLWTRFAADINIVFGVPNLEKQPSVQVEPSEIFLLPQPGTMDWRYASDDQREAFNKIIARMISDIRIRNPSILPCFKGFDKPNNGHLSRAQFRRALQIADLQCSELEMQTLEAKYCDDLGVDYRRFLNEIDPPEPIPLKYIDRVKALRPPGKLPQQKSVTYYDGLMSKIKKKIFCDRMGCAEFMTGFDKLKSGRIKKTQFRRSLDSSKLGLTELETTILEDYYESAVDFSCVDYLRFVDDVETVFTVKYLSKTPTKEVFQFHPQEQMTQNELVPENESLLSVCLKRIADKVRELRLQLPPWFESYDIIHDATVSREQFRRVLTDIKLSNEVITETEWTCLFEKFAAAGNVETRVNYITFCDVIYDIAGYGFRRI